jgi:2-oxo-3-hexenedioate decarboxylase/2-keto-4-pentenoate hydratase
MDEAGIERAAAALLGARSERVRLDALPEGAPATIEEAYRIQDAVIERLGTPAGWKIGCTSEFAQSMLGVGEPFAGRVLAPLVFASPARIPAALLFMRGIEVEFAFRMGRDLPAAGAPYDEAAVAEAVAAVHPAIEIVDSRYHDWLAVGGPHLIADNGCHGALVLGAEADWRGLDLAAVATELWMNGERFAGGAGRDVLGHPLRALAWLANHRAARGEALRAGDIVSTGSTCDALGWAEAGDRAEARFGGLGEVEVTFTDEERAR